MNIDVDQLGKWVAIAIAIGGAAGGVASKCIDIWFKAQSRADRITVKCGMIRPSFVREPALSIESDSDHMLNIEDYGFITWDAKLFSIAANQAYDFEPDDGFGCTGTLTPEKRGESFQCWLDYQPSPAGVYAKTVRMSKAAIAFRYDIGFWQRMLFTLVIRFRTRHSWQNHWDWSPWLLKLVGKQHKGPLDL
ncbi:hypothetical protein [Aquabacterium sp.]|uniref:hypothetical protein n=1 Tax=Aquabacterium sp. TaxID=1872578 RepID=UPI003D6D2A24